jgi:hypothetical protein
MHAGDPSCLCLSIEADHNQNGRSLGGRIVSIFALLHYLYIIPFRNESQEKGQNND